MDLRDSILGFWRILSSQIWGEQSFFASSMRKFPIDLMRKFPIDLKRKLWLICEGIFSRWLSDSIRGCVPASVSHKKIWTTRNWPNLWFLSTTAPAHPKYSPCPLNDCPCPSANCSCPPVSDCLLAVYPALFLKYMCLWVSLLHLILLE